MRKVDPWIVQQQGNVAFYLLADELDWAEVQTPETTFKEGWPELHTWLALMLPAHRYRIYRLYRKVKSWNLLLGIHDPCNNTLFQSAWEGHFLEKV